MKGFFHGSDLTEIISLETALGASNERMLANEIAPQVVGCLLILLAR